MKIIKLAGVAAIAALLLPVAAQSQTTDPGNMTFQCPGCTTTGNASGTTYFLLAVPTTGTYDFYATGSQGDEFTIYFATSPYAVGFDSFYYFTVTGSNNLAYAGSTVLEANTQYYVSAGGVCEPDNQACRVTLNDFRLQQEQVVPEPATMILIGTGLAGVMGVRRRRRAQDLESNV